MRHLTLSILASCLLIACASGPTPTVAVAVTAPPPIKVPPPASLTAPPPPLPDPASGRMLDLEANHRETARQYHLLASRFCSLLAFLQVPADDGCKPFTTAR